MHKNFAVGFLPALLAVMESFDMEAKHSNCYEYGETSCMHYGCPGIDYDYNSPNSTIHCVECERMEDGS